MHGHAVDLSVDRVAGSDQPPQRVRTPRPPRSRCTAPRAIAHRAVGAQRRQRLGRRAGIGEPRPHDRRRLTRAIASASKRASSSATGSSARVMPADRLRPGDDEHRVGVEPVVLRLPEPVGHVPAAHLGVQDGHERHRLARAGRRPRGRTARRRDAAASSPPRRARRTHRRRPGRDSRDRKPRREPPVQRLRTAPASSDAPTRRRRSAARARSRTARGSARAPPA